MELATIGTKYQIVIPRKIRNKFKEIKPGSKVGINAKKKHITVEPIENWSDAHYGAFQKYWKGTDPIAEVEKIRDEWEERLKKFEKISR